MKNTATCFGSLSYH